MSWSSPYASPGLSSRRNFHGIPSTLFLSAGLFHVKQPANLPCPARDFLWRVFFTAALCYTIINAGSSLAMQIISGCAVTATHPGHFMMPRRKAGLPWKTKVLSKGLVFVPVYCHLPPDWTCSGMDHPQGEKAVYQNLSFCRHCVPLLCLAQRLAQRPAAACAGCGRRFRSAGDILQRQFLSFFRGRAGLRQFHPPPFPARSTAAQV